MKDICFTTNWNQKLACTAFTTIRLHNDKDFVVGEKYNVKVKGRLIGVFTIAHKRAFLLDQITDGMAYLDTGYDRIKTIDIIKRIWSSKNLNWSTQKLDYILLVKQQ